MYIILINIILCNNYRRFKIELLGIFKASNTLPSCAYDCHFCKILSHIILTLNVSVIYPGLCTECSNKLNYKHKKKEIKGNKLSKSTKEKSKHLKSQKTSDPQPTTSVQDKDQVDTKVATEENIWSEQLQIEDDKPREDDFENYLEQLLF